MGMGEIMSGEMLDTSMFVGLILAGLGEFAPRP